MKLEELSISRHGNLVVVKHQKYQIEFNLSKGTWNYSNENNKTIIKNAFTQIKLNDSTVLKTSDTGFREFNTEPQKVDDLGNFQTLRFSYETELTREHWNTNNTPNLSDPSNNLSESPKSDKESDSAQDISVAEQDILPVGIGLRIHTYLTCYFDQPYILLKVGMENLNITPVNLTNITLIDTSTPQGAIQLGGHPSQYHLYLKMPPISPNACTHRKIYDGFSLNQDNTLLPCQDGILHDTDSKNSLIFGFITSNKWWPRMQIGYQVKKRRSPRGLTSWALYHDCENKTCGTGEEIMSEIGYLDFSEDASTSYKRFNECLAAENGIQTFQPKEEKNHFHTKLEHLSAPNIFSGWSLSSESIQKELSADIISEQIRSVDKNPLLKPMLSGGIDYIHLDAGWQTNPGELKLDKDRFPKGMQPVVEEIHAKGFKASICIDPFSIDRNSEVVQKQHEICLRPDNEGQSSDNKKAKTAVAAEAVEVHLPGRANPLAILDASHPETRIHVQKVMKQIVDEWDFDLVKVDMSSYTSGMMSIASNVAWYDSSLTSIELYRLAVRILNEAIDETEKDVILSCYNTIESVGIGSFTLNYPLLYQKNSESSDKWHHHNGTKHRLCRYISYLNAQNPFWRHAYGNLSIDEPRPMNEVIVEMTTAALSGASVLCTNTPTTLSKPRAELIAKLFPLSGKAATPVDRYDEPFQRIMHLPVETSQETWHLVGIYNWKDQQDDLYLNLDLLGLSPNKDYLVHDFWMRQYLGIVSKNVTLLNIPPRSAKLLCIREEQQIPQLLSTDIHYTQGGVEILSAGWDNHRQSYLLICQPPRQTDGTFFIHVPEDYIPVGVSAYGSEYEYKWDKPIYQLTFNATESMVQASIQFTKTLGGSQLA